MPITHMLKHMWRPLKSMLSLALMFPCGKWKSAADRSPFHTLYVANSLDNYKKNQVRLLKKFLRSLNVYGAEISRKGFSGYVSEILIIKFGSFLSTLDYFSNFDCG